MSKALAVIVPIAVTDATLVSSTVPETDHTEWAVGTTYALAARVRVTSVHRVYESAIGGNIGNNPVGSLSQWVEVGPTNRWKCFDTSNSTQTAIATSATYVVTLGVGVTNVAILNIKNMISARVRLVSSSVTVYDNTIYTLRAINSASWYEFLIGAKTSDILAMFSDIPVYPNATITVDLVGETTMAFGVLLFGTATALGQSVGYGVNLSIQDYSRKEVNTYGDTVLVQRAYSKKASFNLRLLNTDVDPVVEFLTSIRSTPCLWIGSGLYSSTVVFGIYEDFSVTIAYFSESNCSLNLLGLT